MKIGKYQIYEANTFLKRLIGLSHKKRTEYGLHFKKCHSIHTFFMHFNIDVLLIKDNKIIDYKRNVSPNKIIIFKHKKTEIIEFPHDPSIIINRNDLINHL